MPRTPKGSLPKLRLHKPSGRAVVTVRGRDHYLGKFGSKEAQVAYHRLLARLLADRPAPTARPLPGAMALNEVALHFLEYGERHYRRDGRPTGELDNVKHALGPLCRLYGDTPADQIDFAAALEAVREDMVRAGLARTTINAPVNRLRRVVRYGVRNKWIPAEALAQVDAKVFPGLQAGRRDDVREPKPRRPVTEGQLAATAPSCPGRWRRWRGWSGSPPAGRRTWSSCAGGT
jgi:hypothetical protein